MAEVAPGDQPLGSCRANNSRTNFQYARRGFASKVGSWAAEGEFESGKRIVLSHLRLGDSTTNCGHNGTQSREPRANKLSISRKSRSLRPSSPVSYVLPPVCFLRLFISSKSGSSAYDSRSLAQGVGFIQPLSTTQNAQTLFPKIVASLMLQVPDALLRRRSIAYAPTKAALHR